MVAFSGNVTSSGSISMSAPTLEAEVVLFEEYMRQILHLMNEKSPSTVAELGGGTWVPWTEDIATFTSDEVAKIMGVIQEGINLLGDHEVGRSDDWTRGYIKLPDPKPQPKTEARVIEFPKRAMRQDGWGGFCP